MRSLTKLMLMVVVITVCHSINCHAGIFFPTAKITVKAVDTKGVPIPDAYADAVFYHPGPGWSTGLKVVKGFTDSDGYYTASDTSTSRVSVSAHKEGYYISAKGYRFEETLFLSYWRPWNPVVALVLKEKRNPVSMYAKYMNDTKIPLLESPIGYDLEKGDWVAPYGTGVINDFIFVFHVMVRGDNDRESSFTLTFSNRADGIQEYYFPEDNESDYPWPYEAPETDYLPSIQWMRYNKPNNKYGSDYNEKRNYIFRVRSKTDGQGNIIEARYGKIIRDFDFSRGSEIDFTYYFNPNNNRSLEFDKKNNLFKWPAKSLHNVNDY